MAFTKGFALFHKEAFSLQALAAKRAVEALAVIVVVDGLHPPVASLYGETTGRALRGEQVVPVFFTVRKPILKIEGRVGKDFPAVGAGETLRVEGLGEGLQAIPYDFLATFTAVRSKVSSIAVLTVKVPFFFHKADIHE